MDERDLETEEAATRYAVDELRARGLQLVERGSRDPPSRVRRGASRDHAARGSVRRACRRPSASRARSDSRRRGRDAASTPCSTSGSRCSSRAPKRRLVRRDRLVEVGDRDAEVMDAVPARARCYRAARLIAHGESANGADRLRRARLRRDVRKERIELGHGRASPSRGAPARRDRARRGASAAAASPPRTRSR